LLSQQRPDAPVAVTAILGRQCDDRSCQSVFISPALGQLALRRTMLAQDTADPPFGHIQLQTNVIDRKTATRRA